MPDIPISEIPNIPQVASPVMAQSQMPRDETQRQIRQDINAGTDANKINLRDAAAPGMALQSLGGDVDKVVKSMGDTANQVRAQAQNEFAEQYAPARQAFDQQLQKTDPNTWQVQMQQFNQQFYSDWSNQAGPIKSYLLAPDIIRKQNMDTAEIGVKAHIADLNNQYASFNTTFDQYINNGNWKDGYHLLDNAKKQGLISTADYNAKTDLLQGVTQKRTLGDYIDAHPETAQKDISSAIQKGESLDGWDKITPKELGRYLDYANTKVNGNQTAAVNQFSAQIDTGKIPNIVSLQSQPGFDKLPESKQKALENQIAGIPENDPDAVKKVAFYQAQVAKYDPSSDSDKSQLNNLSEALLGLPKASRQPLQQELDTRANYQDDFGNPKLPEDKQALSGIVHQVENMREHLQLFGDKDSTAALRKQQEIISDVTKWYNTTKAKSGAPSQKEINDYIDTLTQKNQWGAGASEGMQSKPAGGFWNWMTGTKPQASNDDGSAMGRVTSYGYSKDETSDSNTQAGKSAIGKLSPNSLAVSPDIEEKLKSQGIKIGDPVQLHLADGSTVTRIWDDRTAKQYKGKPLTGRFDFYSPKGLASQEGTQVVGVSKA